MNPRSYLFIPGDSEKKLAKADDTQAEALILDLEDAVAPANKGRARDLVHGFLKERPRDSRCAQLWVRINPLESGLALEDLAAVMDTAPDGILLPKANGPEDVARLSMYLDAMEAQCRVMAGSVKIMSVATETATAPFRLGRYAEVVLPRLSGLTWGAEDLSTAIGASTHIDDQGRWLPAFEMVRSLALFAARAANVQPVDTLYVDFRNEQGLRASCQASRALGFTGRIAIHPAQVTAINEEYLPSEAEIAHAERVIAAFAAAGNPGTCSLDGKMIDIPHLRQAQSILARGAQRLSRRE